MLADLAQLTPEPAALGSLLSGLGYELQQFGDGLYAAGNIGHADSPVLLFPAVQPIGTRRPQTRACRQAHLPECHLGRRGLRLYAPWSGGRRSCS